MAFIAQIAENVIPERPLFEAIPSRVSVSGHVYDVVDGLVRTVVPRAYPAGNRQTPALAGSSWQSPTTE